MQLDNTAIAEIQELITSKLTAKQQTKANNGGHYPDAIRRCTKSKEVLAILREIEQQNEQRYFDALDRRSRSTRRSTT